MASPRMDSTPCGSWMSGSEALLGQRFLDLHIFHPVIEFLIVVVINSPVAFGACEMQGAGL